MSDGHRGRVGFSYAPGFFKAGKERDFFESPRISKILDEWLSKRKSVEEGTLSPDDYLAWKLDVIRDMVENP